MKLIPKILLCTSLASTLSFAGMVNGIAIIIDKEPITLYEVYKYAEHFKVNKREALDLLVRQKLEDAQMKKLGISADIFEVDEYIQKMAKQANMSEFDFLSMLKSKNIVIADYKNDLKTKIKRDKLYQSIIREKVGQIDESELQSFYEDNKNQFAMAKEFEVKAYSAKNQQDLIDITKNPMLRPEGVLIEDQTLDATKLNQNVNAMLSQTEVGSFSQIMNVQNGFVMFQVKEKKGTSYISYEDAKNNIYSVLYKQKEQKALSDYFEKLKSSASIKVVRNPS